MLVTMERFFFSFFKPHSLVNCSITRVVQHLQSNNVRYSRLRDSPPKSIVVRVPNVVYTVCCTEYPEIAVLVYHGVREYVTGENEGRNTIYYYRIALCHGPRADIFARHPADCKMNTFRSIGEKVK